MTFGSPTTTGSAIIGTVGIDPATATLSGVSLSTSGSGDTCNVLGTTSTAAGYKVEMFYCLNIHGATNHQVTLSVTGGTAFSAAAAEYANVASASALDVQSSGTNEASPPAGVTSMTPTQSNELVVAGVIWTGSAGAASAPFSQRYGANYISLLDWTQNIPSAMTTVSTAVGQTATVAASFKRQ